jgi:hypothetical protein
MSGSPAAAPYRAKGTSSESRVEGERLAPVCGVIVVAARLTARRGLVDSKGEPAGLAKLEDSGVRPGVN